MQARRRGRSHAADGHPVFKGLTARHAATTLFATGTLSPYMGLPWTPDPLLDVAALLVVAAVVGGLALLARQPLILAFLAAGILAGPSVLGIVRDGDTIHFLGELGITMLLFLVGLRLDPRELRSLGPVALAVGVAQFLITAVLGLALGLALGLGMVGAIYIAVALTFSSTIIIVKLLSDRRELETLHGRVAVGVLIVQDLIVILAFMGLSFAGSSTGFSWVELGLLVLRGVILIVAAWLSVRLARIWLLERLAGSKEFLGIAAVAWAVALAAGAELVGLSKELGAFIAGVTLATTAYRDAIGSRLTSLRDFLLLFFLVDLGSVLDLAVLGDQLIAAIVLSVFVLVGKPLILLAIMGAMGFRRRTGFLTGLTMAQISEFSLILVALGIGLGHLGAEEVGLVTMVALITITGSTYMILYGPRLAQVMEPVLRRFERATPWREVDEVMEAQGYDVLLFGLGRYGDELYQSLVERDLHVLAIDHDPTVLRHARLYEVHARYGDAQDPDFPASLPFGNVQWVVSTIPDAEVNRSLSSALRDHGYRGRIALTSHTIRGAKLLEDVTPDKVLLPFRDASTAAVDQMLDQTDL